MPLCRSVAGKSGKLRQKCRRKMQPKRGRVHFLLWHRQMSGADILQRIELDFLEADHLRVHANIAMQEVCAVRSGALVLVRIFTCV